MTERVVYAIEVVEVEGDQGKRRAAALGTLQLSFEEAFNEAEVVTGTQPYGVLDTPTVGLYAADGGRGE